MPCRQLWALSLARGIDLGFGSLARSLFFPSLAPSLPCSFLGLSSFSLSSFRIQQSGYRQDKLTPQSRLPILVLSFPVISGLPLCHGSKGPFEPWRIDTCSPIW